MLGAKLRPKKDVVGDGREQALVIKAVGFHEIVDISLFYTGCHDGLFLGIGLDCFVFSVDVKGVCCNYNLPQTDQ